MRTLKWSGEIFQFSDWTYRVMKSGKSVWELLGQPSQNIERKPITIRLYGDNSQPILWIMSFSHFGLVETYEDMYRNDGWPELVLEKAIAHIDKFLDRLNTLGVFL